MESSREKLEFITLLCDLMFENPDEFSHLLSNIKTISIELQSALDQARQETDNRRKEADAKLEITQFQLDQITRKNELLLETISERDSRLEKKNRELCELRRTSDELKVKLDTYKDQKSLAMGIQCDMFNMPNRIPEAEAKEAINTKSKYNPEETRTSLRVAESNTENTLTVNEFKDTLERQRQEMEKLKQSRDICLADLISMGDLVTNLKAENQRLSENVEDMEEQICMLKETEEEFVMRQQHDREVLQSLRDSLVRADANQETHDKLQHPHSPKVTFNALSQHFIELSELATSFNVVGELGNNPVPVLYLMLTQALSRRRLKEFLDHGNLNTWFCLSKVNHHGANVGKVYHPGENGCPVHDHGHCISVSVTVQNDQRGLLFKTNPLLTKVQNRQQVAQRSEYGHAM